MGWLPQFKVPNAYDPKWMLQVMESIRTALNFVSGENVSNISDLIEKGSITDDMIESVSTKKLIGQIDVDLTNITIDGGDF